MPLTLTSTVHRILQARILVWLAFPFSRVFSQPRDRTQVSHIPGGFFTSWATKQIQGVFYSEATDLSVNNFKGTFIKTSRLLFDWKLGIVTSQVATWN